MHGCVCVMEIIKEIMKSERYEKEERTATRGCFCVAIVDDGVPIDYFTNLVENMTNI